MKSKNAFSALLSRYETLFLLLLALLVILIYADTLDSPFVFDDKSNIISNSHIRISEISLNSLAQAAFKSPSHQRPLANISFALNYFLHGYNRAGFHLVNILIHIGAGVFLYYFVKTTLKTPALKSRYAHPLWISLFTAAVWMAHPLQTQSISYVVQRMNSMAAMFYVLSMLLYARFRLSAQLKQKGALLAGCILSAILALASKQIAATLPFMILAYEFYFFRDDRPKTRMVLGAGCLLMTAGIAFSFLGGDPLDRILAGYRWREFTPAQRLLTQPRVVIFYLSLLFWPHPDRLNLDHDFVLSQSLTEPISTFFAAAAIAAFLILAVMTAKKQPLISFGIVWFFGNLVIESSILPLEIIFEHRTYLPSMLFGLLIVLFVYRWIRPAWLGTLLLCGVVAVGAVWTHDRNAVYADRITLWRDSVSKSPRKARPHNNLGVALADHGYHDEAIAQYHQTLRIDPQYAETYANIGLSLAEQGRLKESIPQFLKTLEINPEDAQTLSNLGGVLIMLERDAEAVARLRQALKLNPHSAPTHNNLGVALLHQGKFKEAQEHFARALHINPEYAAARKNYRENLNNLE